MGMTIEEIIQEIQIIKAQAEWDYPIDWQIVFDGAIETMQKYQKIAQIMERTVDDGTSMYDTLQEIEEVIEDGNNRA